MGNSVRKDVEVAYNQIKLKSLGDVSNDSKRFLIYLWEIFGFIYDGWLVYDRSIAESEYDDYRNHIPTQQQLDACRYATERTGLCVCRIEKVYEELNSKGFLFYLFKDKKITEGSVPTELALSYLRGSDPLRRLDGIWYDFKINPQKFKNIMNCSSLQKAKLIFANMEYRRALSFTFRQGRDQASDFELQTAKLEFEQAEKEYQEGLRHIHLYMTALLVSLATVLSSFIPYFLK